MFCILNVFLDIFFISFQINPSSIILINIIGRFPFAIHITFFVNMIQELIVHPGFNFMFSFI